MRLTVSIYTIATHVKLNAESFFFLFFCPGKVEFGLLKMEWNVDGGYGTGRGGEKKGSRRIEGRKGVREPRSIKGCQPGRKKKEMELNVDGGVGQGQEEGFYRWGGCRIGGRKGGREHESI